MSHAKTQCLGCNHAKEKHGPRGCTSHTRIDGYRGPDGRCTCKHFMEPERDSEASKRFHRARLNAIYKARRS